MKMNKHMDLAKKVRMKMMNCGGKAYSHGGMVEDPDLLAMENMPMEESDADPFDPNEMRERVKKAIRAARG